MAEKDAIQPARDTITRAPTPALPALLFGSPSRVRYLVLLAACTLGFIAYIHRVGFAPGGVYLMKDLGLSGEQWGVVMAAFLVAYALFEVPWGVLGDRLGTRHLLTVMVLGWSAMTAGLALVGSNALFVESSLVAFALLLALRFAFGVFQAGIYPALSRMMTDWMPMQERGTAQGLVWTCSRLGGAVAPLLMVPLITHTGSWRLSFALVAVLGVVWCAAFWPWFRNTPEEMRRVNAAERDLIAGGRAPRVAGHAHLSWGVLLGSQSAWSLCLMYGFNGCGGNFFITLLPLYLREHRHLSADAMKWLSGLPLAFGVLACVGGGLLSDRIIRRTGNRKWGRRLVGLAGLTVAGFTLLATNWVEDVWVLAGLLSATFFCNDLSMGPAWASVADIGGRYAGTLGGAMNMMANLAGAAGALAAGFLFGKEFVLSLPGGTHALRLPGNDLVFLLFACSYWLASLCWLGVDVTKPLPGGTPGTT
jgi:MFS family permease